MSKEIFKEYIKLFEYYLFNHEKQKQLQTLTRSKQILLPYQNSNTYENELDFKYYIQLLC